MRNTLVVVFFLFSLSVARADTLIDFTNVGALPEQTLITTQHGVAGVTFSNAQLILPGNPATGFSNGGVADTPNAGQNDGKGAIAGGPMISDPSAAGGNTGNFATVTVDFDQAITDLTFQVIDIDGAHQFRGRIYDGGGTLITPQLVVNAGDAGTGDGVATLIDFTAFSGIRQLQFEVENIGSGNSGFGADNFRFTFQAVPEPASIAIWLILGLGLATFGFYRLRKKR